MTIDRLIVQPLSLINHQGQQCVAVSCNTDKAGHAILRAVRKSDGHLLAEKEIALPAGEVHCRILLPVAEKEYEVRWELEDHQGQLLAYANGMWSVPRQWKLYVMISSHTDIGLHNSPYIQRYNSERFVDEAMQLSDQTSGRARENQYRYIMEGKWFWDNYGKDRGIDAAREVVDKYIHTDKMGVCAGIAGNHIQTFGLEEMCRSTYARSRLKAEWGISCKTMAMIDNNGLSWAMVQPYADAGYENILFAPNHWNPRFSTIWPCDTSVLSYTWNPEAGGGGSRVDFRFPSALPQVFFWEAADGEHKLLFWGGGNYPSGMSVFGMYPTYEATLNTLRQMEAAVAKQLPVMEKKYPYDLWFCACYRDDQEPDLNLVNCIAQWNEHWQWPRFEAVADPDAPFAELRRRFEKKIPVLRGDITGGWYQHPVSAAEILAQKFEADRLLPTAEKLASLAGVIDEHYQYPAKAFDRAWDALLCNDEHSYGVSGYQGQRVYETWMQHRDWINTAMNTASQEAEQALQCIASHVTAEEESTVVFNPTMQQYSAWVKSPWDDQNAALIDLPSFGYKTVPKSAFQWLDTRHEVLLTPPVVENRYYRLAFAKDGSIRSIYDKELCCELLDQQQDVGANTFLYTQDDHKSFHRSNAAQFSLEQNAAYIRVTASFSDPFSGADIVQIVTVPGHEKRIEIDNCLSHVRDMFNNCRYDRYAYYAFPFQLENARRLCHLNGCVAEYGKDLTGHSTDVYMAAHEWCCVQNEKMGIALMQLDSELVEFDHIHPEKTDYGRVGDGSYIFSYLANDWLQMHVPGGDELNYRFRYAITSFAGDYAAAGLSEMAERFGHAPMTATIGKQSGTLPQEKSFLNGDTRLLTLKRAEDGKGLIARLYGNKTAIKGALAEQMEWNTIDEQPTDDVPKVGFQTLRLGCDQYRLQERETIEPADSLAIGQLYTGLIQRPCAACGEKPGMMYLLWGHAKDAASYEVYRNGERIAVVARGEYCVGRYTDENLQNYAVYEYQVRAMDRDGRFGLMSEVFKGRTRQC